MDVRAWVVEQLALIQESIERLQADLNANIGAKQAFEAFIAKIDKDGDSNSD